MRFVPQCHRLARRAEKDILEFVRISKNIIDADSDNENEMTIAASLTKSPENAVAFPSYPKHARLERDLAVQGSVLQAERQFIATRTVCGLAEK
ncbi:hypothetical protein TNCV_2663071 [Trichonephila clavipes]|nr:hypothetical protein TNCV_2663071 [Trichonephila clavipes]